MTDVLTEAQQVYAAEVLPAAQALRDALAAGNPTGSTTESADAPAHA